MMIIGCDLHTRYQQIALHELARVGIYHRSQPGYLRALACGDS
jgi:hypothetical protein